MFECEVGALLPFSHAINKCLQFGIRPLCFFGAALISKDGFSVNFHDGCHIMLEIVGKRLNQQGAS